MTAERANKKINGWGEDKEKVDSTTLDLLGMGTSNSPSSSSSRGSELIEFDLLELGQGQCLPFGWEKCIDLKTGAVYYLNSEEGSEVRSNLLSSQKGSEISFNEREEERLSLDLKLNLSTSIVNKTREKNNYFCITNNDNIAREAEPAVTLVGCQKCLMYFMVCSQDVNCPKCRGAFLLTFLHRDPFSD